MSYLIIRKKTIIIKCCFNMMQRKLYRFVNNVFVNKQILRTITVAKEVVSRSEDVNLKSWREIPGPSSLPIIGPFLHHLPGGSLYGLNGREMTVKLYNTYGPIVRMDPLIGLDPLIFLFDANSVEQILRGENIRMPVRPGFKTLDHYRNNVKDKNPGDPNGLITDHGEPWKEFRGIINPIMAPPKTIKLYAQALNEVALEMVGRIKSFRDENNMMKDNFDQEMNLWSLESIGVVALGCRIGCFNSNLPEDDPAKQLIRCVHDLFIITEELDFKPNIWKYVTTPKYKKCMKIFAEQEALNKYFINKAMEHFKKNPKKDSEKSILEKLLEIDEKVAYVMASDMLFAGVDTAANTVTATLYLLAVNQDKQNKLREELKSNPETRYLKACLKESLRMMPIVSGNSRITTREYNIMGYKIPANIQIMFCHQDMALMEQNFIRPDEYIPERWLAEKGDPLYYRNAHPFAYNPFGFGVRSCIGRRIAELEMETFVARAVENFRIDWNGPPPKVKTTTINYVKGPFSFVFNDIKNI